MSNPSSDSYRNALRHMGQDYSFAPRYIRARDPHSPTNASNDIKPKEQQGYYPTGSFWTNSTNGNLWALQKITNNLANWILLSGGSSGPLLNITVDAATAPGTNPVVPSGTGNITITGAQVATGTIGAHVIRTNSVAANEFNIEIQRSTAVASTDSTKNGVSHFNSTEFTVDGNGFVSLTGGGVAITSLTGDDALPVVPTAGNINLDGVTVTNGTHAKPVFFAKNATSTEELDVQVTTTSTSGAKSINKAGLASFDSTAFNVDAATGWISLVTPITPNPFSQINVQRVTATGAFTYTPTANMKYVIVELIGGGGGSGGVASTTGNVAMGGGGGAGGYAKFLLTAAQVGVSLTGSIGAGGAAGASGNNNGGSGGNTTLATSSPWTAAGGQFGQGSAAGTTQAYNGAPGGTVTAGTGQTFVAQTGGASGSAGGSTTFIIGGYGGSSFYGAGAPGVANSTLNTAAPGVAATGFGSGASGPISFGTAAAQTGVAGQAGVAIFTEFI